LKFNIRYFHFQFCEMANSRANFHWLFLFSVQQTRCQCLSVMLSVDFRNLVTVRICSFSSFGFSPILQLK
jgi:hypothetical protein